MRILVSNDDGIDSPGILALVHSMSELGEVTVVAPDRQQSAVGHSMTLSNPLRVTKFHRDGEMFGFSVNGTPADCVKLAIAELMPEPPDIVVSGINHGPNTAVNILYSGTVSAATEGMLSGIPSMAISVDSHSYDANLDAAIYYAKILASNLKSMNLPLNTLMNVNIPSSNRSEVKGIKVAPHNSSLWKDAYLKRIDPFEREYYWFSGEYLVTENNKHTDDVYLAEGYVVATPIHFDLTNHKLLESLKYLEDLI